MLKKTRYSSVQKLIAFTVFFTGINLHAQIVQEFMIEKPEMKTTLSERKLKGKVKTLKTCFFTIENTSKQQNIKRLLNPNLYGMYETFNSHGRLTKNIKLHPPVYFPMDTIGGDSLVYNNKGKLEKSFYTNGFGTHFVKTFNDKEDQLSREEINKDKDSHMSNDYFSYKYNSAGKKTEAQKYSFYGSQMDKKKIDTRAYFKYDPKNRLIEEIRYGEVLSMFINPKEIPLKFSYKYDLNDNIIEESCFYKKLAYKAAYTYDAKNVLIKQVLIEGPKTDSAILKDGRISQRTVTNRNNYVENRIYKYEYDTTGNWIKLNISTTFSENGQKRTKQETLVTQEITYYE